MLVCQLIWYYPRQSIRIVSHALMSLKLRLSLWGLNTSSSLSTPSMSRLETANLSCGKLVPIWTSLILERNQIQHLSIFVSTITLQGSIFIHQKDPTTTNWSNWRLSSHLRTFEEQQQQNHHLTILNHHHHEWPNLHYIPPSHWIIHLRFPGHLATIVEDIGQLGCVIVLGRIRTGVWLKYHRFDRIHHELLA